VTDGLRILVVDDHPVNRLLLKEIFTHLGGVVSIAEDGMQALSILAVDHFDLICLDRHMPGMSGDEVVECLPRDQFVLAWSTDPCDLPARFNGTLAKPVSLAAARAAMTRAQAWRTWAAPRDPEVAPRAAA
jgi:CheY-like chemotaxis protein